MPIYAIGGINQNNIHRLVRAGFRKVAVIRAVCGARDPFKTAIKLKRALS